MSFTNFHKNVSSKHKLLDNSEIIGLDESIENQLTYEYNKFQIKVQHYKKNIIIYLNFEKLPYKDYFKYLAIFKILKKKTINDKVQKVFIKDLIIDKIFGFYPKEKEKPQGLHRGKAATAHRGRRKSTGKYYQSRNKTESQGA